MAKRGRKTKLDAGVTERIILLLKAGNTRRAAAESSGIHIDTFYSWLNQGALDASALDTTEFSEFSDAVMKAESETEILMNEAIRKAARGYDAPSRRVKTRTLTEIVRKPDGKPVLGKDGNPLTVEVTQTEVTEIVGFQFHPNMAVEWLKRRRRAEWGDSLDVRKLDDETLLRLLADAGAESKPE